MYREVDVPPKVSLNTPFSRVLTKMFRFGQRLAKHIGEITTLTTHSCVFPMGFGLPMLWVMGYEDIMDYGPNFPANQVGNSKKLWVIREYGLWEL